MNYVNSRAENNYNSVKRLDLDKNYGLHNLPAWFQIIGTNISKTSKFSSKKNITMLNNPAITLVRARIRRSEGTMKNIVNIKIKESKISIRLGICR